MATFEIEIDKRTSRGKYLYHLLAIMGLIADKKAVDEEENEKEAFLYTSKVNASKIFAKYL